MIGDILLGLGFVAVIEGLVLALAPIRFEDLLARLRDIDPKTRQTLGFLSVVIGSLLIWFAKNVIA